jgi:hypothetical protein
MTYPVFASGDVLNASDMNGVGLWLVKSQTVGTGVGSVAVTDAFTADYDSYKVIYDGGVGSTFITIAMQLGASTASYNMSLPYVTYGAAAAAGTSVLNATSFALMGAGDTSYAGVDVDVLSPNLARFTRVQGAYIANNESGSYSGIHKVATAYTGFTLIISGGSVTGGTIRVYGYRK